LICVVSAVSRDVISPVLTVKEGGRQRGQMRKHGRAQIGDHALADDGHKVVTRRACGRQHARDRDHHGEILIDQPDALGREAEIDHASHRERHNQRGGRRDQQCHQGGASLDAIAHDVGDQRQQRAHPQPARRLHGRRGRRRFLPFAHIVHQA